MTAMAITYVVALPASEPAADRLTIRAKARRRNSRIGRSNGMTTSSTSYQCRTM